MFQILWDPSSGSIERAWLKLLVMFRVSSRCLAAWYLDFNMKRNVKFVQYSSYYTILYKFDRGFQKVYAPRFPWHSAHEGGEVVSLTHWPPSPPGMFLVLIFTRGWVDPRAMVRSEGNISLKNPVTLPGIYHGTVRLVAQRLNHYATPGK